MQKLLRISEVMELTSLSRATVYRYIDKGIFPKPKSLGAGSRAVLFRSSDIEEIIKSKFNN
jgi:prophage regulatory protein